MSAKANHRSEASIVLDAGALTATERGDLRIADLLMRAMAQGNPVCIPAGALGQVWRDGSRQVRLSRLLADPGVEVVPLDKDRAQAAGALCGFTKTRDVIDASVVLCARERGHTLIITSEPDDLARLDPRARIMAL